MKICCYFASLPPRIDDQIVSLFRIGETLLYQVELKINFVDR